MDKDKILRYLPNGLKVERFQYFTNGEIYYIANGNYMYYPDGRSAHEFDVPLYDFEEELTAPIPDWLVETFTPVEELDKID